MSFGSVRVILKRNACGCLGVLGGCRYLLGFLGKMSVKTVLVVVG